MCLAKKVFVRVPVEVIYIYIYKTFYLCLQIFFRIIYGIDSCFQVKLSVGLHGLQAEKLDHSDLHNTDY